MPFHCAGGGVDFFYDFRVVGDEFHGVIPAVPIHFVSVFLLHGPGEVINQVSPKFQGFFVVVSSFGLLPGKVIDEGVESVQLKGFVVEFPGYHVRFGFLGHTG